MTFNPPKLREKIAAYPPLPPGYVWIRGTLSPIASTSSTAARPTRCATA